MPVCNKVGTVTDKYVRDRTAETSYLHTRYGVTVPADTRIYANWGKHLNPDEIKSGFSYAHHGAHVTDLQMREQFRQMREQFRLDPTPDIIARFDSEATHKACREKWLATNARKMPVHPKNGERIYVATEPFQQSIGTGIQESRPPLTPVKNVIGVYRYIQTGLLDSSGIWQEVVLYPRISKGDPFEKSYLNRALIALNPHVARTDEDARSILDLFLSTREDREHFARKFADMMNDKKVGSSEKYDRYVGDLLGDEKEAQKALERGWLLAFRTPWVASEHKKEAATASP